MGFALNENGRVLLRILIEKKMVYTGVIAFTSYLNWTGLEAAEGNRISLQDKRDSLDEVSLTI